MITMVRLLIQRIKGNFDLFNKKIKPSCQQQKGLKFTGKQDPITAF